MVCAEKAPVFQRMKVSIITPNFNGARHLEECLHSVQAQRRNGLEIEHIVLDAGSTDGSREILMRHRGALAHLIIEPDRGPADAINKGFHLATGEWVAWLNADDRYADDAVIRAMQIAASHPRASFVFGRCRIIDESGREIRKGITRFKELFFPVSSRFVFQCINYISQPATFFRRSAVEAVGPLRLDLKAAFDYEFFLRLWRHGGAARIPGPPLADFRWHPASISGQHFARQFQEEFEAAKADAGRFAPQTLIHWFVRWGIVWSYSWMTRPCRKVLAP